MTDSPQKPMPGSDPKKRMLGYAIAAVFPLLCIVLFFHYTYRTVVYRTYLSPDGRYELTVYRTPPLHLVAKPELYGNDPGFVSLVKKANGKELQRVNLPKVNKIRDVEWGREYVEIADLDAWFLPR